MKFAYLALALLALPAFAEEPNDPSHPCFADKKKFCESVKPGGGAIIKCMKEHEAELSAACKAKMAAGKEKMHEGREACHGDVEKHCKDVKPGGGAIILCLKKHEGELSAGCKGSLPDRK